MSTTIEGPSDTKHSDSGVVAPHDSEEYESAEEIYDDEEVEEIEVEVEEEEDEEEEGDGAKEKELDDDEDRQNPQFIPKKGYFYEHDDRTKTEDENEEPEKEVKEEKPKKVFKEVDRWAHDCFDEQEQNAKSNEELVKIYGYNIREEDQPPKAVRRRRYGRGPKKYTRKSDDGEAYQKPRGGYGGRGRRGNFHGRDSEGAAGGGYDEEFPQLKTNNKDKPTPPSLENLGSGDDGSVTNKPRQENRDHNNRSGGRGGGQYRPRQNRPRDSDNREQRENRHTESFEENRNQSYNNESNRGRRGGGYSGGRRHRNEFTNRNRYAENRYDSSSNQNLSGNNFTRKSDHHPSKDVDFNSKREKSWQEHDTTRGSKGNNETTTNSSTPLTPRPESTIIADQNLSSLQKGPPKSVTLPFTNTEYTGSASLTSSKSNISASGPSDTNKQNQDFEQNSNSPRNRNNIRVEGGGGGGEVERNVEPTRIDPRIDSRDVPRPRPVPKSYNANERRPQLPLRLQQQQQQRHENLQQQQQQQQLEQTSLSAGKPKRFSTQRQRQVVDTSSLQQQQQQQTSMPSQMIPQVVPVQTPVVTVAGSMVTSPVPSYPPPPQTYYDSAPPNFDAQVYENTGNLSGNVPASVSPNLWGPHAAAYATAGQPVQPTVQYADPSAFIAATQPTGPIFAAPPQFIQDAAMLNFAPAPAPPFAPPPYQGYPQGYPQVTPAPPPEVYHAGVTYYNTQNQIQRPPVMAVQKRPKSVLQLVEPPEKLKQNKDNHLQQPESRRDDPESFLTSATAGNSHQSNNTEFVQLNNNAEENLSRDLANLSTDALESSQLEAEAESWASQMDQMSPTDTVAPPESNKLKSVQVPEVSITSSSVLSSQSPEMLLKSTAAPSPVVAEIEAQSINENLIDNSANIPQDKDVEAENVGVTSTNNTNIIINTSETGKSDSEVITLSKTTDVQEVEIESEPPQETRTKPSSATDTLDSGDSSK